MEYIQHICITQCVVVHIFKFNVELQPNMIDIVRIFHGIDIEYWHHGNAIILVWVFPSIRSNACVNKYDFSRRFPLRIYSSIFFLANNLFKDGKYANTKLSGIFHIQKLYQKLWNQINMNQHLFARKKKQKYGKSFKNYNFKLSINWECVHAIWNRLIAQLHVKSYFYSYYLYSFRFFLYSLKA